MALYLFTVQLVVAAGAILDDSLSLDVQGGADSGMFQLQATKAQQQSSDNQGVYMDCSFSDEKANGFRLGDHHTRPWRWPCRTAFESMSDVRTILCVGDSMTAGTNLIKGNLLTQAYPSQLYSALNQQFNIINLGVPQASVVNYGAWNHTGAYGYAWARFPTYDFVLESRFDALIIQLGSYDACGELKWNRTVFEQDYSMMVERLLERNKNAILIFSIPPAVKWGFEKMNMHAEIVNEEVPQAIQSVQRSMQDKGFHTKIVDMQNAFAGHEDMFVDGVHPDIRGYTVMSTALAAAVRARHV